jgi:hypothetical protein
MRAHISIFFLGLVLSVLLIATYHDMSAQTRNGEGDGWLKMNSDNQFGFVYGYTIGLSRGFAQGCQTYAEIAPPQKPHRLKDDLRLKCGDKGFGFSKPVEVYQKQITDFYTSFPADHDVPFEQVLKRLSDSESMTPQQMHEWFKEHDYRHSWR